MRYFPWELLLCVMMGLVFFIFGAIYETPELEFGGGLIVGTCAGCVYTLEWVKRIRK